MPVIQMTLLKIAKAPTRCICLDFSFRLWKKESFNITIFIPL